MYFSTNSLTAKRRFPSSLACGEFLPPVLSLDTTNRCNVFCIMCDRAQRARKLSQKSQSTWLTVDKVKKDFEGIKRIRSAVLSAGHGEPFLNRDLMEIISFLKSRKAFVEVISNGTLLTRNVLEKIINVGLDRIYISLHGARSNTAETIMEKSNFNKIVSSLQELKAMKREVPSELPLLEILFVAMKRNIKELSQMVALASEVGASAVNIQSLNERQQEGLVELKGESLIWHPELFQKEYEKAMIASQKYKIHLNVNPPYSSMISKNEPSMSSNFSEAMPTVKVPEGETRYCIFPFVKPFIELNGDIRLCCSSQGRYVRMGNVSPDGFTFVWNSDEYTNIRRALLTGRDLPPYCVECDRAPVVEPFVMQMDIALRQNISSDNKEAWNFVRYNKRRYGEYVRRMASINAVAQPYRRRTKWMLWQRKMND